MGKVDYKNAWQTLKEEKIRKFVKLHNLIIKGYEDEGDYLRHQEQCQELIEMDMRDNTNEFSNLLHDMNRSE
ncbi:hypothetical protein MUA27_10535 [Mammaliicoccus sciuri]|uniref:hypothetical protein n=1 Tax=Mammaliicoccus sciuri TaxID=1296 RepID=UPI0021D17E9B|nr:hypothetical protein [Mammaliicoccus sciuri]UXU77304.1 hypothetical protein MUA27_10535 [Mammaliicoccus sciuri]